MKIEGTQYPLPVRPAGHRSGNSNHDVDVSDDAVYFEPDERRKKEGQQHQPDGEQPKQETLDQQVSSEAVEAEPLSDAVVKEEAKKDARPALNVIA